jgi:hypothetical protein
MHCILILLGNSTKTSVSTLKVKFHNEIYVEATENVGHLARHFYYNNWDSKGHPNI